MCVNKVIGWTMTETISIGTAQLMAITLLTISLLQSPSYDVCVTPVLQDYSEYIVQNPNITQIHADVYWDLYEPSGECMDQFRIS